ncbi:uncharacterized protein LY89DRAFT_424490 [Mollisia scopiformis]|uniref:Secreted protein n=1 Tax=Mollisia scopiformis TaxID=149040 RepID=A0A194XLK2_MOLSC|nr:uncharacterized protein LY89DRAFT_424490 [Mollisia scopiformis]KUJ21058.1 hypothetical protein LY89DRAFT_424490 [Mollisia scopiformis]
MVGSEKQHMTCNAALLLPHWGLWCFLGDSSAVVHCTSKDLLQFLQCCCQSPNSHGEVLGRWDIAHLYRPVKTHLIRWRSSDSTPDFESAASHVIQKTIIYPSVCTDKHRFARVTKRSNCASHLYPPYIVHIETRSSFSATRCFAYNKWSGVLHLLGQFVAPSQIKRSTFHPTSSFHGFMIQDIRTFSKRVLL